MEISVRFKGMSHPSLYRYAPGIEFDWRYPRLFDFLKISPSYRIAHLIATGQIERNSRPLPVDFELVEQTYEMFGDVDRPNFIEWWYMVAQFRFGVSAIAEPRMLLRLPHGAEPSASHVEDVHAALERYTTTERQAEGLPAVFVVAIPVSHDRKRVLRDVAGLIDREFGPEPKNAVLPPARLIDNKMRERTLETAMRVLFARCKTPWAKLYELGSWTKIAPAYVTKRSARRRDDDAIDRKRERMEVVVSRHLHRAYLLAENAARGRFPTLDPLPDDPDRPKFDYWAMSEQLHAENRVAFPKDLKNKHVPPRLPPNV